MWQHTRDCVTRLVTSQKRAFILVDYRQSQTWLQPEALDIHSRKQLRQVCFLEHELSWVRTEIKWHRKAYFAVRDSALHVEWNLPQARQQLCSITLRQFPEIMMLALGLLHESRLLILNSSIENRWTGNARNKLPSNRNLVQSLGGWYLVSPIAITLLCSPSYALILLPDLRPSAQRPP